jgi:hypothetical protein
MRIVHEVSFGGAVRTVDAAQRDLAFTRRVRSFQEIFSAILVAGWFTVMPIRCLRWFVALFALSLLSCVPSLAASDPVLMISIDGLKPEYVTHADEHGLKIPTLRRFLHEGSFAEGVIPVLPSVTYPNHTTLITGVTPAEHGILNNLLFDPENRFGGAWYWYAESIRVPTLWDAAHSAGLSTASVSWPVSVNAASVDWLLPEYWRSSSPGESANEQDRYLMRAISRPVGELAEMESRLGPYMQGNDTSVAGDATRTRFALDILRRHKPNLMTIHLSAMDGSEHASGMFSQQANQTLEAVDAMVQQLMAAALKNNPRTRIVIVSDHGFLNLTHSANLSIPFVRVGLIDSGSREGWKVQLWSAGGVAAVMLRNPADAELREQVSKLLASLAADPENGIDRVLDARATTESGGFTGASFLVVMKPGYAVAGALNGPLVVPLATVHGSHGFWPQFPEMRSSLFILGEGVAQGRNLGTIDMRQIAPTVANILGVKLPTAKQPVLPIY